MLERFLPALAAFGLLASGLQAAGSGGYYFFEEVSLRDAQRELTGTTDFTTPAAMWIWSDKYVYQANEQLSVRWTLKPNNDLYPYTIVAYRQNNQTGARTYLPNNTSQPTDIFGNTPDQGFRIVRLNQVDKGPLVGSGGMFPAITVPNELGMHTIVVQIRDFTGTRIVKAAYQKIGVVSGFENLTGDVTANRELVNTVAYRLSGLVNVKGGATLTIQPGTFIIGQPGSQPPSALVVTQEGKLHAVGTRSRPIIMTSSQPFGQRRPGDWGGLVLLGKARANWPGGVGNIEGLNPGPDSTYGGQDDNHDCGAMKYLRVEFAGAELRPNDEINSITWGGCGKATSSEYLQAHYGLDDAFEWFGGNNDGKYLVATYARDDYFDGQIGWRGRVQHAVAVVNQSNGNRGIELDNNENDFGANPPSAPQFYNLTFVGAGHLFQQGADEGDSVAGLWPRRGAQGLFNNMLIYNWVSWGMDIRDNATLNNLDNNTLTADGILLWDNGKFTNRPNTIEGQVAANARPFLSGQRGQARNIMIANPMLRRPLEYSDPDFLPALGSPVFRANWVQPPDDGFFDQWATWIGAFGYVDWTEEWTTFLQEEDIRLP